MTRVFLTLAAALLLAGCVATPTPVEPSVTPETIASTLPTPTPTPVETPAGPTFIVDDPGPFAVDGWEGVHFISPSGNIGCGIMDFDGLWGCLIAEHDWEFPHEKPGDVCYQPEIPCGMGIESAGSELPHAAMRSDVAYPGAEAIYNGNVGEYHVATLAYGHSLSHGDVTCTSEEAHITCFHTKSGHGFVLSRDENTIF